MCSQNGCEHLKPKMTFNPNEQALFSCWILQHLRPVLTLIKQKHVNYLVQVHPLH